MNLLNCWVIIGTNWKQSQDNVVKPFVQLEASEQDDGEEDRSPSTKVRKSKYIVKAELQPIMKTLQGSLQPVFNEVKKGDDYVLDHNLEELADNYIQVE